MLALTSSAASSGCATTHQKVTIHPISGEDIFSVDKGTQIGSHITPKDGFFVSSDWLGDLAEVKAQE